MRDRKSSTRRRRGKAMFFEARPFDPADDQVGEPLRARTESVP